MAKTKDQRVHLRVAASDNELFRSASAATNESLSEFLVESGRERAERLLADRTRFVLSATQWRRFTAALDRPWREIPELVELFLRPRPGQCHSSAISSRSGRITWARASTVVGRRWMFGW